MRVHKLELNCQGARAGQPGSVFLLDTPPQYQVMLATRLWYGACVNRGSMNWITYRINLEKLTRKKEKIQESLDSKVKQAARTEGEEAANEVWQTDDDRIDLECLKEMIHLLKTRYYHAKSDKLLLTFPDQTEKDGLWRAGQFSRDWYLTRKGFEKVHSEIKKEDRERLDTFIKITSTLIGLLGVIIGVLAVIKS